MMSDQDALQLGGQPMTLRDITAQDMPDVLALHQRVFGSAADPAWFAWKYAQGSGEATGVWHQGELIAHCGGLPRRFLHAGSIEHNLQIGDVMVAPQWRGLLTRQGPFFHVSKNMYDTRLGAGKRYRMGFGFPNARALRLGMKSGLTWDVGQMVALQWNTPPQEPQLAIPALSKLLWRVSRLEPHTAAFSAAIDSAWSGMQADAGLLMLGERSADYVHWRFVQRPQHPAFFLQLRRPWQRKAIGVAVLTPATPEQPFVQWLDWIGPPKWIAHACAMCRHEAARLGAPGLTAWASRAVVDRLEASGISGQSEAARISVAKASDISQEGALHLPWWLMGGDTDFL